MEGEVLEGHSRDNDRREWGVRQPEVLGGMGDLGSPRSLRSAPNAEAYLTPGPHSRRARASGLSRATILANARFFGNDIAAMPRMALTVGLKIVLDSREVVVVVTGKRKALTLSMAIEHGVNHLWTLSEQRMHPWALLVVGEDATAGTGTCARELGMVITITQGCASKQSTSGLLSASTKR